MIIEEKLDQVIAILLRIETLLCSNKGSNIIPIKITESKATTPTKSQIEFQRYIEFANRYSGKLFQSSIRKEINNILEIRKSNPNYVPKISLEKSLIRIDEKIKKTNSQFYKDLRVRTENMQKTINDEAKMVLDRAINRQTVRGK